MNWLIMTLLLKRRVYRYTPFDKRAAYRHVGITNCPLCCAAGVPKPSLLRGRYTAWYAIHIYLHNGGIVILLLHSISQSGSFVRQFHSVLVTRFSFNFRITMRFWDMDVVNLYIILPLYVEIPQDDLGLRVFAW